MVPLLQMSFWRTLRSVACRPVQHRTQLPPTRPSKGGRQQITAPANRSSARSRPDRSGATGLAIRLAANVDLNKARNGF